MENFQSGVFVFGVWCFLLALRVEGESCAVCSAKQVFSEVCVVEV